MDEKKVINHFCHEHPLILRNVSEIVGLFERGEIVDCYGCGNPINESESETEMAYVCMQQECSNNRIRSSIFHKKCGELPNEISHPIHPHHPLHLFDFHFLRGHRCDVCCRYMGSMLGYRCSSCEFDLDITCEKVGIDALLEERKNEVNHPSHPHPLTLMRKPAIAFYCHGCGERDVDMPYICSSCEFWVHKSCALLPLVYQHHRHSHPLSLTFSFQEEHRKYIFYLRCEVCDKFLDGTCWAYSCADCRYFVHLKCAAASSSTTKPAHSNLNEDNHNTGVIQLPLHVHDIYKELITPFVMREKGVDAKDMIIPATAANSAYHKHPLSLVSEEADEVMICDVCVTPISSPPHYECRTCGSYFIHSICYFLPRSLQYSSPHDQDQLYGHCKNKNHNFELCTNPKSKDKVANWRKCNQCKLLTNGMWYECDECHINIDVKCASLPTSIRHASHSHLRHKPLILSGIPEQEILEWGSSNYCRGCLQYFNQSRIAYCCSSDGCDFALHLNCAQLPPSITKHEWDNCTHPLLLIYGTSPDHPSDFFCEFCEKEMNPLAWMYHCRQCDISCHPDCLDTASGRFRNIRFGSRFEVDDIHPHPLTFNCITLNKWCRLCHRNVYTYPGFECQSCYYAVCRPCGLLQLAKI